MGAIGPGDGASRDHPASRHGGERLARRRERGLVPRYDLAVACRTGERPRYRDRLTLGY
jgi:hypothetical protein